MRPAAADWRQTLTRTARDGQERALFVAEAGGQVAGYGRVVLVQADPNRPASAPPGWYLLGLVVDPAWRRRGIGEALTRARMAPGTWIFPGGRPDDAGSQQFYCADLGRPHCRP